MDLVNAKCPEGLTFIESLAWVIDHFDGYLDENQLKLVSRLNISKKDRRRVAELLGLDPDELTMTDEDKIAAKNQPTTPRQARACRGVSPQRGAGGISFWSFNPSPSSVSGSLPTVLPSVGKPRNPLKNRANRPVRSTHCPHRTEKEP